MGGVWKPDNNSNAGGGGSRSSSLEGLLQQAWLQSQSRVKVPRRSVSDPLTDVSVEKRTSSPSFAQLVSGSNSGGVGEAANVSEEAYFHKARPEEVPEFLRRRATPRLVSYSKKNHLPRSRSTSQAVESRSSVSQDSATSLTFSSSGSELSNGTSDSVVNGTHVSMDDLFDAADSELVESETNRYCEEILYEPLHLEKCLTQLTTACYAKRSLSTDDLLCPYSAADDAFDAEAEFWNCALMQRSVEKTSAYQAMAKEIASLMSSDPNTLDAAECQSEKHESTNESPFAPSDESAALKIMEGFTSMMSKHIEDVSVSNADLVDSRTWITEDADRIDANFDDHWKAYFDDCHQSLLKTASFDSTLFHGANLSRDGSEITFPPCSGMMDLLYRCAFAVSRGEASNATECLEELRKHSSPYGHAMERMVHYVREALVAKLSGTGEQLYTVITNNHPSAETMFKANRLMVDSCPYVKLKHFLSSKSILDAFVGASRVHVIHYGVLFGTEWPSLLKHLSMRPEGPPHFRFTAIDFPYPGDDPLKKIKGVGRRLERFAQSFGVGFEFQGLARNNWESITARDIDIRKDEVLAVCCHRCHLMHDEGVLGESSRELLLKRIRSLNPKVVVLFVESAACNAPFFMTRFRESVKHYSALYYGLEVAIAADAPERVIFEREVFGRELLNIIGCEGKARIERLEPYWQWQNRMDRAGFIPRPLNRVVFCKMETMMTSYHRDFGMGEDDGWLLMGIKDQITFATAVFEPKAAMCFIN